MDCQFCLDPYGVLVYIVNYINKESRGLSVVLAEVIKECKQRNMKIDDTVKKLGHVFVNKTEISVQESIYMLLGLPLTHCSSQIVTANTYHPNKRTKILKSLKELKDEHLDSTNIYRINKFDIYVNRPDCF